jgi:hypothetical protein
MTPRAESTPVGTRELLAQRLELVYRWYEGMVDPTTGRFEYLYAPETDAFIRKQSPIRDIASIWDAEALGEFLRRDTLRPSIEKSLRHYAGWLVERDGCRILDSDRLDEPSSIAHSAFMILALLHEPGPRRSETIAALAEGILRQQRPDGSYKVYFDDFPDEGEELYAGEAMLALGECHRRAPDARHLASVERAFAFYDAQYFRSGRVRDDVLVFFANWQSQACRLLFEDTLDATLKRKVATYLHDMHDRIVELGFYERVRAHPERRVSVEVACAIEGLNDAYAVLRAANDKEAVDRYWPCICAGLAYLLDLQCTQSRAQREVGGFGMSFGERMQRIDVTGHAASAFMKAARNEIACAPAAATTPSRH